MVRIEEKPNDEFRMMKGFKEQLPDKLDVPMGLPRMNGFRMAILGPPHSGKTYLSNSLICGRGKARVYRAEFNHVYIFMPQQTFDSLDVKHCFRKHPTEKIFHDMSADTLTQLADTLRENRSMDENSLVLIDDFASELKNPKIEHVLNHLFTTSRHLMTSIILLSQGFRFIPRPLRKLMTYFVIFRPNSKGEMNDIFEEIVGQKELMQPIYDHCYKEPYSHMDISLEANPPMIMRNFHELVITDDCGVDINDRDTIRVHFDEKLY